MENNASGETPYHHPQHRPEHAVDSNQGLANGNGGTPTDSHAELAREQADVAHQSGTPTHRADSPAPASETPRRQTRAAARVESMTKVYGSGETKVVALDDVSVEFYAGEFTAIMGKSGSGKSTLMHCAAGLDSVTKGHAYLGDTEITSLSEKKLTITRRDHIGFVFQAFNLIPTLTAEENIVLPLAIAGRKPDPQWFDQVIAAVGLADRLGHRPSQMSGGQQQRVACARALMSRPDVIFADEPTGNLDSNSGADVLKFLRSAVDEQHQTVVMVTHDPGAASWTDRVLFLADGHIVRDMRNPTPEGILAAMGELEHLVEV